MPTPDQTNDKASDTRKPRRLASLAMTLALVGGAILGGLYLPHFGAFTPPEARMPKGEEMGLEDPAGLTTNLNRAAAANLFDLEFATMSGEKASLSDYIGRPVLLNFWASWCAPCVKEMPELDALAKRHSGLVVLVASLNATSAEAQDWLKQHKISHVTPLMDQGGKQLAKLGQTGLPTTLLIREDGSLAERMEGFRKWDAPEMKAKLAALLAK